MKKTVEETRRELFEQSTAIPEGVGWSVETNSYVGKNFWVVQYAWETLNSALDSVVIELPKPISEFNKNADGYINPVAVEYDECIEDCKDSIESTNLGIKIK